MSVPVIGKRKRTDGSKKKSRLSKMLRAGLFFEGSEQENAEGGHHVSGYQDREELVEGCNFDFSSWSMSVRGKDPV